MSELKLPTISPKMAHMMVNASGEDWSSWNNAVISAVSVKINPRADCAGVRAAEYPR
jgi:hypothetical protein